jgi:hypothetical protein
MKERLLFTFPINNARHTDHHKQRGELTQKRKIVLEKLIITQVLKKFPIFKGIRRYISIRHSPEPGQQGSSLPNLFLQDPL